MPILVLILGVVLLLITRVADFYSNIPVPEYSEYKRTPSYWTQGKGIGPMHLFAPICIGTLSNLSCDRNFLSRSCYFKYIISARNLPFRMNCEQ
jgi:hypothetical protein